MRAVGFIPTSSSQSRFWQTTCTLVRSGEEAFCIDSPVLPDELEILPAVAEQAGFKVVGLFATHGDWDHLLGRYAFPEAPLGAAESTALRMRDEPGVAQRLLREFDEDNYVERPCRCRCRACRRCRSPATRRSASTSWSCTPPTATPPTGWPSGSPGRRAHLRRLPLARRDPDDLPGGSRDAYLATLARLEPLVDQAAHVVPGHGAPLDGTRAAAILREDVAYLRGSPKRRCRSRAGPRRRSASTRTTSRRWAEAYRECAGSVPAWGVRANCGW